MEAVNTENLLSKKIIGASIEVHKTLGGPGLLESVYEEALCYELSLLKIPFQRQLAVPVLYKGQRIKDPFFIDIMINNEVIVEIKAVEKLHSIHKTQLLTYLRLTQKKLGLLINFGGYNLVEGITRIVN